jgi:MOSC domain-containing protein YiiM
VQIRHLFIAAGHSYFGRHGQAPGPHPIQEVEQVECVAGHGLRGDRFFNYKEDYRGQVTLFDWGVFEKLRRDLSVPEASPGALRRNVIVEGADLVALIGNTFEVQGVRLQGIEECRPCHWMDGAIGPGAEAWLRGRGGLRCRILTDGVLVRDAKTT